MTNLLTRDEEDDGKIYLTDIPLDLLTCIAAFLSPRSIALLGSVGKAFRTLPENGIRLWAHENGFDVPKQPDERCAARSLCRAALMYEAAGTISADQSIMVVDKQKRVLVKNLLPSAGKWEVAKLTTATNARVKVQTSCKHFFAVVDGCAWSWGDEWVGQLGQGTWNRKGALPKKIEALANVTSLSASHAHCLALTTGGNVWSWGSGRNGKLGHGNIHNHTLPKRIDAFGQRVVVSISAGFDHSIAITSDGSIWSWGDGEGGVLGHGDERDQALPKRIEAFADHHVIAASAGVNHTLAITAEGAVWAWGADPRSWSNTLVGILGDGSRDLASFIPKKVEALAGQTFVAVSAATEHSLALTADGAVWSWGCGENGVLGHGDDEDRMPAKIATFDDRCVVAVVAGDIHNLAVTADGSSWSWGCGCPNEGGPSKQQLLPERILDDMVAFE